jgi:IS5 family transposase
MREETWETINQVILGYAKQEKIESGRKVRIDATAVDTDIHHPTDSTLLADGVRIITRWLTAAKGYPLLPVMHTATIDGSSRSDVRPSTVIKSFSLVASPL